MGCKKYKYRISDYIDGALVDPERKNLESHLEKCADCRRELEMLQNYKQFSSSVEQRKAPESIKKNIWSAIRDEKTIGFEERKGRVLSMKLAWVVMAASILSIALIIPRLTGPNEIIINFDYQPVSLGRGPEDKAGNEEDTRASAIISIAEELDCKIKRVIYNPAGITDGLVIKIPKKRYNSFRQQINSYNISENMQEIDFRLNRGSIIVQVYFSGRKFFTGDFNNDGLIDMGAYFSQGQNSGRFYVACNDGKDGFLKPVRFSIDDTLGFLKRTDIIMCGDFNNDGSDDLLIHFPVRLNSGRWIIYLNNGNDGFAKGIACMSGVTEFEGSDQQYTFTGDFNGDGYTDIGIHYIKGKNAGKFLVCYNTKNLVFTAPVEFITGLSGLPSSQKYTPVILDINKDGYSDIIVYWQEGERTAMWYVSENTGSGKSARDYKAGFNKGTLAFWGDYLPFTGDTDGDGFDDLMVKDGTSDEVTNWYLMKNDGDGSFSTADHFIDFNGDKDFMVR